MYIMPPLYIRYPESLWILFDDKNEAIQHQKKGLELFIASGKDSLDVSIPHSNGGQFIVGYDKKQVTDDIILYFYITNTLQTVQMMYAEPEYIAYINRLTSLND